MASNGNRSKGGGIAPKITLYTNHQCPYAHRSHIALKELGLPYEEVIIDLEKPREPWYFEEINPRGLVPSIKISNGILSNEIITESGIVCQFLADMRPSHLLPASMSTPTAPLERARINFFIDTWNTKISSHLFTALKAASSDEKAAKCTDWIAAIRKEIEPLLKGCDPFFAGNAQMTLAEVNAAPFILRIYTCAHGGLLPKSLLSDLDALPNFTKWAQAIRAQESATFVYDEEKILAGMKKRVEIMRGMK